MEKIPALYIQKLQKSLISGHIYYWNVSKIVLITTVKPEIILKFWIFK